MSTDQYVNFHQSKKNYFKMQRAPVNTINSRSKGHVKMYILKLEEVIPKKRGIKCLFC